MFLCPLQNYKNHLKLAIPKNGDAAVYQLLSIASFLKRLTFAPEIEKERSDDYHSRAIELRNSLSSLIALRRY